MNNIIADKKFIDFGGVNKPTYSFKQLGEHLNLIKGGNDFTGTSSVGGSVVTVKKETLRNTGGKEAYSIATTGGNQLIKAVKSFESPSGINGGTVSILVHNAGIQPITVRFNNVLKDTQTPELTIESLDAQKITFTGVETTANTIEIEFIADKVADELSVLVSNFTLKDILNDEQGYTPHVDDYVGESNFRHLQGTNLTHTFTVTNGTYQVMLQVKNISSEVLTIDFGEFGIETIDPNEYKFIRKEAEVTKGGITIVFNGEVDMIVHNLRLEKNLIYKLVTEFYNNPTYSFEEIRQGAVPELFEGESDYRYIEVRYNPFPSLELFPGHSAKSSQSKLYPMIAEEAD